MAKRIICIDIGSSKTVIYLFNTGIIYNEPTKIAYNTLTNECKAVGFEADKLDGKSSKKFTKIVVPFKEGLIYDSNALEDMLKMIEKKLPINNKNIFKDAILIFPMAKDSSKLERKFFKELGTRFYAKKTFVISSMLLAYLGLNVDKKDSAYLTVDIGLGTTDIAVISMNEIIKRKTVNFSSSYLDRDINLYIREKYNMFIGSIELNDLKLALSCLTDYDPPKFYVLTGRDSLTSLPKQVKISSTEISKIYQKSFIFIAEIIISLLESLPTNFMKDIVNNGLVIFGGLSKIKGLKSFLEQIFKMKIRILKDPELRVVLGTAKIEDYLDELIQQSKIEDKFLF